MGFFGVFAWLPLLRLIHLCCSFQAQGLDKPQCALHFHQARYILLLLHDLDSLRKPRRSKFESRFLLGLGQWAWMLSSLLVRLVGLAV